MPDSTSLGPACEAQTGIVPIAGERPIHLYIEGHNHRLGYAISRELVDAPPARYYTNLRRARRLVERFNRRFGA